MHNISTITCSLNKTQFDLGDFGRDINEGEKSEEKTIFWCVSLEKKMGVKTDGTWVPSPRTPQNAIFPK